MTLLDYTGLAILAALMVYVSSGDIESWWRNSVLGEAWRELKAEFRWWRD